MRLDVYMVMSSVSSSPAVNVSSQWSDITVDFTQWLIISTLLMIIDQKFHVVQILWEYQQSFPQYCHDIHIEVLGVKYGDN